MTVKVKFNVGVTVSEALHKVAKKVQTEITSSSQSHFMSHSFALSLC